MRRAALIALGLALASPAFAQTNAEVIGRYQVTVEPEPGSVCQPGQAMFEVHRVGDDLMEVSLDGTRTVADWHPDQKTFAGTIPFPDGDHLVRLDGTFVRSSDRVTIVVQVEFPPNQPCKATLSGSIPAAEQTPPSTPPPSLGSAPAPSVPPVFGVSPNGDPVNLPPPAPAPAGTGFKDPGLLGGIFVLMLLLGLMLGLGRARQARAAAVPPPEPAPEPAPTAKPPRKPRAPKPPT